MNNQIQFNAKILILPGLGNSGEVHWQTLWQSQFGFNRIEQKSWDNPVCNDWVETIDKYIVALNSEDIILVGHSLACTTIATWASKYSRKIKAALLVAPSDTEAPSYPEGTTGFKPMCLGKLPFTSIVVSSSDDYYVTLDRAKEFATAWGSEFINIGSAGHINVASGHGEWSEGLEILKRLDK